MQSGIALIVGGPSRQEGVARALASRHVQAMVVEDTVGAMAALGRARFRALVVLGAEKNAALPLRVLCRVARHRHKGIGVVVMRAPAQGAVIVDDDPDIRLEEIALDATDAEVAALALSVMRGDDDVSELDDVTTPDLPTKPPLLEGALVGGGGPAILAGIFAQELTGKLAVESGAAKGTLLFAAGEPVALDDDDEPTAAASSPAEVLSAHRAHVRARVCAFIEQTSGTYVFHEDAKFLDARMLSKVSPFGLILDVRRRHTTPASMLDLSAQLARKYMNAGVGLERADARLKQFTRDKSIAGSLKGGDVPVEKFLADVGLDSLMGSLVVLTLADARLISLSDEPTQRPVTASIPLGELLSQAKNPFVLGEQNSLLVDSTEPEAQAARERVDRLYVELKPAKDPYAVLGVAAGSTQAEIDAAYKKRLAALMIDGADDANVLARLDELRRKVDQARSTLMEVTAPQSAPNKTAPKPLSSPALLPPREQLGRYEILGILGAGGMAEVFLGRRIGTAGFEKRVVIKRILKELAKSPQIVRMFLEEARVAARLQHQNIVQIYDLGESNGEYYIVMELIDGPSLEKLIVDSKATGMTIPVDIAAYVVGEICGALTAAHTHADDNGRPVPIIHRDVTTHNILIGSDGQVKLADFGVAKSADALDKTMPGMLKGKAHYLAPEYIQGAPADARLDVFAAGIVLYQCLTGEHPYERLTADQAMSAILTTNPEPIGQLRGGVPRAVEQITMRALARDVNERFQTAHAFHLALDSYSAATGRIAGAKDLARYVREVLAARPGAAAPEETAPIAPAPRPITAMTAPPPTPATNTAFEEQTLELTWPFAKGG